jgi:hypothetical protein
MSPDGAASGQKGFSISNVYTALLAMALGAVCATAGLVVFKCFVQYGTVLKIIQLGK